MKTDKEGHPVPNGTGKRWWSRLTLDERRLHTDWRFDAGHRNSDVESALDLSVGTVSGIKRIWRERKAEAMEGAAKDTPVRDRAKPEPPVAPAQPASAPPAPSPKPEPAQKPAVTPTAKKGKASRIVSTKLSGDPHNDCGYSGRCGYERLPGETSCGRPGHDK